MNSLRNLILILGAFLTFFTYKCTGRYIDEAKSGEFTTEIENIPTQDYTEFFNIFDQTSNPLINQTDLSDLYDQTLNTYDNQLDFSDFYNKTSNPLINQTEFSDFHEQTLNTFLNQTEYLNFFNQTLNQAINQTKTFDLDTINSDRNFNSSISKSKKCKTSNINTYQNVDLFNSGQRVDLLLFSACLYHYLIRTDGFKSKDNNINFKDFDIIDYGTQTKPELYFVWEYKEDRKDINLKDSHYQKKLSNLKERNIEQYEAIDKSIKMFQDIKIIDLPSFQNIKYIFLRGDKFLINFKNKDASMMGIFITDNFDFQYISNLYIKFQENYDSCLNHNEITKRVMKCCFKYSFYKLINTEFPQILNSLYKNYINNCLRTKIADPINKLLEKRN